MRLVLFPSRHVQYIFTQASVWLATGRTLAAFHRSAIRLSLNKNSALDQCLFSFLSLLRSEEDTSGSGFGFGEVTENTLPAGVM